MGVTPLTRGIFGIHNKLNNLIEIIYKEIEMKKGLNLIIRNVHAENYE